MNKKWMLFLMTIFISLSAATQEQGYRARVTFSDIKPNFPEHMLKYLGKTIDVFNLRINGKIFYVSNGISNSIPFDFVKSIDILTTWQDGFVVNLILKTGRNLANFKCKISENIKLSTYENDEVLGGQREVSIDARLYYHIKKIDFALGEEGTK